MAPPTIVTLPTADPNTQTQSDWISRVTIPDMYPRRYDPFRPAVTAIPGVSPQQIINEALPPPSPAEDLMDEVTTPGQRPQVFQRGLNTTINLVANTPQSLMPVQFACDSMLVDVYSTAANSVFFGFGNGVTVTNGLEIQPGLPVLFKPENTREQWELQRSLEFIAILLAKQGNVIPPSVYKAPRVVFDASDWFLVAAANTAVTVVLFYIPEMQ